PPPPRPPPFPYTTLFRSGLDIPAVRHVYNYDLPNVPENYIHRIGRTARAGAEGRAMAFCAPAEAEELRAIEKALKARLPVAGGEDRKSTRLNSSHVKISY